MQEIKRINVDRETLEYGIIVVLSVISYLFLMWILTGRGLFTHNVYDSYAIQANAWRMGHLDIPENYGYLEIAVYKGKYFISFPPFPSYILFPLTFIFGQNTPDSMLLWLADIVTSLYLYKLALRFKNSPRASALCALFVMLGTNVTFNMLNPWVWFWAQTLCFMLSVMAIYYAFEGKGGLCLGLWACAVGCRPMQAVFVPILLYILYRKERNNDPDISPLGIIRKRLIWALPPCLIGGSYMLLNYLRFDNPLEFGHNYLQEFMEAEYGQFDPHYFSNNFKLLFHIPEFDDEGRMVIDHFGNLNMFIVSPFVIFAIVLVVALIAKKQWKSAMRNIVIMCFCVIYMVITMMHKTMGGWHFGNRYSNDILPWIYLTVALGLSRVKKAAKYQIPIMIFGMCLNAVGLVVVYNDLYRM